MAGETYYFFLSILLVLGALLHITNIAYYKAKRKTVLGERYKSGTPEYEKLSKIVSNRNLVIALIATPFLVVNLAFSAHRVASLDTPDSHFLLIFAPIASILFLIMMLFVVRNMLKSNKLQ